MIQVLINGLKLLVRFFFDVANVTAGLLVFGVIYLLYAPFWAIGAIHHWAFEEDFSVEGRSKYKKRNIL